MDRELLRRIVRVEARFEKTDRFEAGTKSTSVRTRSGAESSGAMLNWATSEGERKLWGIGSPSSCMIVAGKEVRETGSWITLRATGCGRCRIRGTRTSSSYSVRVWPSQPRSRNSSP